MMRSFISSFTKLFRRNPDTHNEVPFETLQRFAAVLTFVPLPEPIASIEPVRALSLHGKIERQRMALRDLLSKTTLPLSNERDVDAVGELLRNLALMEEEYFFIVRPESSSSS